MALPISSISLANTFGQWIIVTQNIVTELNALDNTIKNGTLIKNSGTLFINSTGTGLAVANTATFGNIQVSNTALFSGNVIFNRPITVNTTNALIAGVDLRENSITFSTISPKGDTYLSVNRGTGFSNAQIRWLEASKKWQIRNVDSPSSYYNIITSNDGATTSSSGVVQLNDDYNSSSTTQAATINAVRKAYNALSGGVSYEVVFNQANTAYNQANTAYNRANAAYSLAESAAGGGIIKISGTSGFATPNSGQITITSTNGITIVGSANTLTLNTPQDLRTTGSPTFVNVLGQTFTAPDDFENYFTKGTLSVRGANPSIRLRDTNSGSVWLNVDANTLNFTYNTSPDAATSYTNIAAAFNLNGKYWTYPANTITEGTIFCENEIVSKSYISANSIGTTVFKATQQLNFQANNAQKLFLEANNSTVLLPASPVVGNFITISVGDFTNTTILRNGKKIMNIAEDMQIDIANVSVSLVYADDAIGWKIV